MSNVTKHLLRFILHIVSCMVGGGFMGYLFLPQDWPSNLFACLLWVTLCFILVRPKLNTN
jgi:hypothetical protein